MVTLPPGGMGMVLVSWPVPKETSTEGAFDATSTTTEVPAIAVLGPRMIFPPWGARARSRGQVSAGVGMKLSGWVRIVATSRAPMQER